MINIIKFTKSYFSIDIYNEYYEGYHNPEYRWNGWAAPYFTKEIADKIMQNMSSNDCRITYDKEKNQYVVIFNDEQEEIYNMEIINTDEGKKQVYSIGSCSWTWDNYSLEEIGNDSDAIIVKSHIENDKEFPINIEY